jgi:MFS family permease
MIKTKTFYMISLVMALVVPAYVFVNPLMKSLGMERGLTNSQALLGVMIASFTNIIGRFVAPWISDKIGCRKIMQIMYILAAISVFGLISARGVLFVAFISLVCMVYGGMVSVSPVWVAQNFGMKYQGMNYGVALMGYGIVSILCPYLLEITGQTTSFIIAGICSLVGVIIMRKI